MEAEKSGIRSEIDKVCVYNRHDPVQADFVHQIEDLNVALRSSWESDQRVKALKIAIQCAKLLVDVSVLQFYPIKFALITDMLDSFGALVYKRIHCKAETPSSLESAQETCRNWFYKVASIRELVPRIYVETAILKTLSFIVDPKLVYSENCKALNRLTAMARGIGDPLVSCYARAYICHITMRIAPMEKKLFRQNLTEFITASNQLSSSFVIVAVKAQKISFASYLTLFTPALNWILQCITFKASVNILEEILDEFEENLKDKGNQPINALLLNSMIVTFEPQFITERAKRIVDLVKECFTTNEEKGFPGYLLLKNLGTSFVDGGSTWFAVEKAHKLLLMNEVWKKVAKLKSGQHIACAEVWMDFVVNYLGAFEVNLLLKDIVKHMQPDRAYEDHYDSLISIVRKVTQLSTLEDYTSFFSMDSLIPFLGMLQKESIKVDACQIIVQCYLQKIKNANSAILNAAIDDEEGLWTIADPVTINSLTYLCKTIHDSVNTLTLDDDRREISKLIIDFLNLVTFHRDFQAYLNFLVEARSNFSHLESVAAFLVNRVNRLIMETRAIVKGQHSKKTTAFVRACLAYSFITIPSLDDTYISLQLYLNCAQIALVNGCLPQTDAFLEAAIDLIPSINIKTELSDGQVRLMEPIIVSYVANVLSFLIIVPDHPEKEPLFLFRQLFQVIKNMEFHQSFDSKPAIYLNMLAYLFSVAQENYSYHIEKVDSNDTLYGHSPPFLDHINQLNEQIIEEIFIYIKDLGRRQLVKRQSSVSFDCFYRLITHGDTKKVGKLAFNFWQLGLKGNLLDNNSFTKGINFVSKMSKCYNDPDLLILSQKMASLAK